MRSSHYFFCCKNVHLGSHADFWNLYSVLGDKGSSSFSTLFRVGRQGLLVHHSCSLWSPRCIVVFVRVVKVVSEVVVVFTRWGTVCWREGLGDLSLATVIQVDGGAKVFQEGSNDFSTRLLPPLGVLRLFALQHQEEISEWITARTME